MKGIKIRILVMLRAKRIENAVEIAASLFSGLMFAVESISMVKR